MKKGTFAGWWLPAVALLWSEGIYYSNLCREELLVCMGELFTMLFMLWCMSGISLLVIAIIGIQKKIIWARIALLVLPLGLLQASLIDYKALSEKRWQALHPEFEAQLSEALQIPLKPEGDGAFGVRVLRPKTRVVVDQQGNRSVAFIRYRVGLDNGIAYVYCPSNSLQVEMGRMSNGLGYALSGFGEIARIDSLGNHWYRCYFT